MFYKTVRRFLDPDGSQGGAPAGEQTDQQSQQNAAPQIDYGKSSRCWMERLRQKRIRH